MSERASIAGDAWHRSAFSTSICFRETVDGIIAVGDSCGYGGRSCRVNSPGDTADWSWANLSRLITTGGIHVEWWGRRVGNRRGYRRRGRWPAVCLSGKQSCGRFHGIYRRMAHVSYPPEVGFCGKFHFVCCAAANFRLLVCRRLFRSYRVRCYKSICDWEDAKA